MKQEMVQHWLTMYLRLHKQLYKHKGSINQGKIKGLYILSWVKIDMLLIHLK